MICALCGLDAEPTERQIKYGTTAISRRTLESRPLNIKGKMVKAIKSNGHWILPVRTEKGHIDLRRSQVYHERDGDGWLYEIKEGFERGKVLVAFSREERR